MQRITKFIYYKIMGWKVDGTFPSNVKKCVIIAVPHTSNMDFFLGLVIRKVWSEEINWIGKKSLFKFPYGWFFRWVGGAPVDRAKNNDMVSATAELFAKRDKFRLTLAPEGTRKKVDTWKTGFYYIARAAKVPVIMVAFDYGNKQIKVSEPYNITENKEADFNVFYDFYKGVKGRVSKNSF